MYNSIYEKLVVLSDSTYGKEFSFINNI